MNIDDSTKSSESLSNTTVTEISRPQAQAVPGQLRTPLTQPKLARTKVV